MKGLVFFIFFTLSFLTPTSGMGQSKLEQSKSEIKREKKKREQAPRSSGEIPSEEPVQSLMQRGIVNGFLYGLYYIGIGNLKKEEHLHHRLSAYPYAYGREGNYSDHDTVASSRRYRFDMQNYLLYSNDNLYGDHFKADLRPFEYFYVQAHLTFLNETDDLYNKRYALHLYNLNLGYDRLRFERWNLGWLLGMSYIGNEVQKAGFTWGATTDIFFLKPLSISASGRWSFIHQSPVHVLEARINYHKKRFKLSIGYEYMKIATPDYHFLSEGLGVYW